MSELQFFKDIKRRTRLGAFLYRALCLKTYKHNIFWEDQSALTFVLLCTSKRKREYTEEVTKIFKDYRRFEIGKKENTLNKSETDDTNLRSGLLNSMKMSPYVHIYQERSSNDEKFCFFTQRFKNVIAQVQRQRQATENDQLASDEEIDFYHSFVLQDSQSSVNNQENQVTSLLREATIPNYAISLNQPEEENCIVLDVEDSFIRLEDGSSIDPARDIQNNDLVTSAFSSMDDIPLLDESAFMDPDEMFTNPVEESSVFPFQLNSLHEVLFNENSSTCILFDFANAESDGNQFCLPCEEESILLSSHCLVTETDDQPQKSTEGLKGSGTLHQPAFYPV